MGTVKAIATQAVEPFGHTEEAYGLFLRTIIGRFTELASAKDVHLFTTDAEGLFDAFLAGFPDSQLRQHYTCHSCRRFVDSYGGLVVVAENGETTPAMWAFDLDGIYTLAVDAVRQAVARAKVNGVFLAKESTWGIPITGEWNHMHVVPPRPMVYQSRILTPGQAMAEKREEHGMLCRALADFSVDMVARVLPLLESDALYRSEKVLGVARWFHDLHEKIANLRGPRRDAIIWRAVAGAPAGWCHIRSTMIGTLLEDAASGMDFDAIAARFRDKMHPLQYRRPTAAPNDAAIKQAEELFAKLGLAPALERRFATIDDIQTVWRPATPTSATPAGAGIFSHLKGGGARGKPADLHVPAQSITWKKFAETILPGAEEIAFRVPMAGNFIALVAAVNPGAPPIFQWDAEERRNQVSWYVYPGGSPASRWQLVAGEYVKVTGMCLFPPQWDETRPAQNYAKGAIAILDGAVDQADAGLGLFPEILRSELHGVRSVIEAHSCQGKLVGRELASACGVDLRQWGQVFRVKIVGRPGTVDYKIDRWD